MIRDARMTQGRSQEERGERPGLSRTPIVCIEAINDITTAISAHKIAQRLRMRLEPR